jgi:hypothetical protein
MKQFWLFIGLLGCYATDHSADCSPERTIAGFFGPDGFDLKEQCYTGEMLAHTADKTLGETLAEGTTIRSRLLELSSAESPVFAVDLTNDRAVQNWYAFFSKADGQLKLQAVRTLALTGMPQLALDELENKSIRTAEEEWQFRNLALWLSSDAELKDYARLHRLVLEKIATFAKMGNAAVATTLSRNIFFTNVEALPDGSVKLALGGILDNTVGYINIPPGVQAPLISDDNYIFIELIEGEWYLYKTT